MTIWHKTRAYKVFTHDWCSPLQGGAPVFDGTFPFQLPTVEVDKSNQECAAGWNACRESHVALQVAGLWPTGRPSRLTLVETASPVFDRGNKCRAATWTVLEEVDATDAIRKLSEPFGEFAEEMAVEQIAWREALARPKSQPGEVEQNLKIALEMRGLHWELKKFDIVREARNARAVWEARNAREARDAWDAWAAWAAWAARATRNAWAARAAWDAWDAWAARAAWDAWDARAAWAAWDAWDAWDARAALMIFFASRKKWIETDSNSLTTGLRDAYINGLELAIPVAKNTLGWSMSK